MYRDDPDNQCFSNMIESLYLYHPVRIDIGGTKESVKQINSSHLKEIQKSFYTPKAIIVTIAGDIDEEEILALLEKCLESSNLSKKSDSDKANLKASKRPVFAYEDEPSKIGKSSSSYEMDVSTESFLIGIKNPAVSPKATLAGYDRVINNKSGQMFFEMILGSSSEIFETLYAEGLVNDSFGFQYVCEETYSYVAMGGESPNPKLAARKLHKLLLDIFPKLDKAIAKEKSDSGKNPENLLTNLGIDKQILLNEDDDSLNPNDFELQKRVVAGNFIRSLDSVEYCGMSAAIAELSGLNIFDYPEIYDKMELATVVDSMRFLCNPDLKTESFIFKKAMGK